MFNFDELVDKVRHFANPEIWQEFRRISAIVHVEHDEAGIAMSHWNALNDRYMEWLDSLIYIEKAVEEFAPDLLGEVPFHTFPKNNSGNVTNETLFNDRALKMRRLLGLLLDRSRSEPKQQEPTNELNKIFNQAPALSCPATPEAAKKDALTLDAKATAARITNPEWTYQQIAEAIGCNVGSLYRCETFTSISRGFKEGGKQEMRRAEKKRPSMDDYQDN